MKLNLKTLLGTYLQVACVMSILYDSFFETTGLFEKSYATGRLINLRLLFGFCAVVWMLIHLFIYAEKASERTGTAPYIFPDALQQRFRGFPLILMCIEMITLFPLLVLPIETSFLFAKYGCAICYMFWVIASLYMHRFQRINDGPTWKQKMKMYIKAKHKR